MLEKISYNDPSLDLVLRIAALRGQAVAAALQKTSARLCAREMQSGDRDVAILLAAGLDAYAQSALDPGQEIHVGSADADRLSKHSSDLARLQTLGATASEYLGVDVLDALEFTLFQKESSALRLAGGRVLYGAGGRAMQPARSAVAARTGSSASQRAFTPGRSSSNRVLGEYYQAAKPPTSLLGKVKTKIKSFFGTPDDTQAIARSRIDAARQARVQRQSARAETLAARRTDAFNQTRAAGQAKGRGRAWDEELAFRSAPDLPTPLTGVGGTPRSVRSPNRTSLGTRQNQTAMGVRNADDAAEGLKSAETLSPVAGRTAIGRRTSPAVQATRAADSSAGQTAMGARAAETAMGVRTPLAAGQTAMGARAAQTASPVAGRTAMGVRAAETAGPTANQTAMGVRTSPAIGQTAAAAAPAALAASAATDVAAVGARTADAAAPAATQAARTADAAAPAASAAPESAASIKPSAYDDFAEVPDGVRMTGEQSAMYLRRLNELNPSSPEYARLAQRWKANDDMTVARIRQAHQRQADNGLIPQSAVNQETLESAQRFGYGRSADEARMFQAQMDQRAAENAARKATRTAAPPAPATAAPAAAATTQLAPAATQAAAAQAAATTRFAPATTQAAAAQAAATTQFAPAATQAARAASAAPAAPTVAASRAAQRVTPAAAPPPAAIAAAAPTPPPSITALQADGTVNMRETLKNLRNSHPEGSAARKAFQDQIDQIDEAAKAAKAAGGAGGAAPAAAAAAGAAAADAAPSMFLQGVRQGDDAILNQLSQSSLGQRLVGTSAAPLNAAEQMNLKLVQVNAYRSARANGKVTPDFTDWQTGIQQTAGSPGVGRLQTQRGYTQKLDAELQRLMTTPLQGASSGPGMMGYALAGGAGLAGGAMLAGRGEGG